MANSNNSNTFLNINSIFNLPSVETYSQNYRNYVIAENPEINPNIKNTDFWYKSIGIGGIGAGIIGDAAINFINIFPQYLSGAYINLGLSARGLPAQFAATYATATLGTGSAPSATFTVLAGMQLTNTYNNAIYEILTTTTINISDSASYNNIPAICTVLGLGNQLPNGTVLTFSNPPLDVDNNPVDTLIVQSSADGSNAETSNAAVQRVLGATQIPQAGSRITDYYNFAIVGGNQYLGGTTPVITDCVTLPNNQFQNVNFNFGVFGIGGTPITDYILNQSILYGSTPGTYTPFTRTLPSNAITAISNSIQAQQQIDAKPYVNSVITQNLPTVQSFVVTPYFQVSVTLYPGLTLSSVLQINSFDQYGDPIVISITVSNLIKREIRRAVCQQDYGATLSLNSNGGIIGSTILLSSIEQQLDYALGTANFQGAYATVLVDRQVFVYNPSVPGYAYGNIPLSIGVPNPPSSPITDYPLAWIYDIADDPLIGYDNITVQLLS